MRPGLPYENVFLTTADGVRLHAYLLRHTDQGSASTWTVLYLHGNAGSCVAAEWMVSPADCLLRTDISHRLRSAAMLFYYSGVNVFLLEYRGYGRSEGVPSEAGLYADAQVCVMVCMCVCDGVMV
jgi:fermentation-respiration switch protein FrsA (DUF1100 family)